MCAKFHGRSAVDGTRQTNFAIFRLTKKVALIGGFSGIYRRNEKGISLP
jgi:hypothetical protein